LQSCEYDSAACVSVAVAVRLRLVTEGTRPALYVGVPVTKLGSRVPVLRDSWEREASFDSREIKYVAVVVVSCAVTRTRITVVPTTVAKETLVPPVAGREVQVVPPSLLYCTALATVESGIAVTVIFVVPSGSEILYA
jgi:hypothetical protein